MENTKSKFARGLEIATNLSIVVVALVGTTVLVKNHLLRSNVPRAGDNKVATIDRSSGRPGDSARGERPAMPPAPAIGSQISVPGVNWSESDETVLLALSNTCHFCTESAPFYQKLLRETAERKNLRVVAVFPQEVGQGKKYLDDLNVPITQIAQASLDSFKVRGTPTLLIVDKSGTIKQAWVGRLNAERESEVLNRIKT